MNKKTSVVNFVNVSIKKIYILNEMKKYDKNFLY